MERLARDWPVYIMVIGIISFFIYAFVSSAREAKKNKDAGNIVKDKIPDKNK